LKIIGIIPARKGSKRLHDKNNRPLAGKPLFAYVAEAALKSKLLDSVVLSTNHEGIISYSRTHFPTIEVVQRPEELCTDESPAIDYILHALTVMEENYGKQFDMVLILQPSSPLTLPEDIDHTISLLKSTKADSAVSVVKLNHMVHPVKMKVMEKDKLIPYLEEEEGRMAAHDLSEVYVRNCSVYASKIEVIEQGKIFGDDCRGFVMPPERSVDINEMIDFLFAEFLLQSERHKC